MRKFLGILCVVCVVSGCILEEDKEQECLDDCSLFADWAINESGCELFEIFDDPAVFGCSMICREDPDCAPPTQKMSCEDVYDTMDESLICAGLWGEEDTDTGFEDSDDGDEFNAEECLDECSKWLSWGLGREMTEADCDLGDYTLQGCETVCTYEAYLVGCEYSFDYQRSCTRLGLEYTAVSDCLFEYGVLP